MSNLSPCNYTTHSFWGKCNGRSSTWFGCRSHSPEPGQVQPHFWGWSCQSLAGNFFLILFGSSTCLYVFVPWAGNCEGFRYASYNSHWRHICKNLVIGIVQRARDMPLLLRRMLWELMDPQRAIPLVHRTRILFFVSVFSLLPES
jgi:hypothetical protein